MSKSTSARPKSGNVQPPSPRTWTPLEPRRGKVRDQRKHVGHSAFVQKWLADKKESQLQFLTRIPEVHDAQCAWQLLLMCAGPRANHILRNLTPSDVSPFGQNHDDRLRARLADILAVLVPDGVVAEMVQLLFHEGGLGLRSASGSAPAAQWAVLGRLFVPPGACLSTTGVHTASPGIGRRTTIQSPVCAGRSGRSRVAGS